jgi:hypothetical protein
MEKAMSRSRKNNPFVGNTTAATEKPDKKLGHRRHRQQVKQILNSLDLDALDDELLDLDEELPLIEEISNPWNFAKDGKHRVESDSVYLRK